MRNRQGAMQAALLLVRSVRADMISTVMRGDDSVDAIVLKMRLSAVCGHVELLCIGQIHWFSSCLRSLVVVLAKSQAPGLHILAAARVHTQFCSGSINSDRHHLNCASFGKVLGSRAILAKCLDVCQTG